MKITILTDNKKSWFIKYAKELKNILSKDYEVRHIYSSDDIINGDIMFILSCERILKQKHLEFNKHNKTQTTFYRLNRVVQTYVTYRCAF